MLPPESAFVAQVSAQTKPSRKKPKPEDRWLQLYGQTPTTAAVFDLWDLHASLNREEGHQPDTHPRGRV